MAPAQRPELQLIVTQPELAVARLHRLIGQRAPLRASFQETWRRIAADASEPELEDWAEKLLELAHVNAGPACLIAALRLSERLSDQLALATAAVGHAAEICRRAGNAAAHAALAAMPDVLARLRAQQAVERWWQSLRRVATLAPESAAALAQHSAAILEQCDEAGFASFLAAGLKVGGAFGTLDRRRRLAFFSLEDAAARRLLQSAAAAVGFRDCERALRLFVTALFGKVPKLRPVSSDATRRATLTGDIILLPEFYPGVAADDARQLFRAAAAHAACHLAFGSVRQPVGSLKPLQIALVTLIEDARVEMLAMRRFPGLRRLWARHHTAEPSDGDAAAALLARLSRALFDPGYRDGNDFIARGRALFAEVASAWHDPASSRRIGGLLGNDLGQQRLQFNPRTYVIEPIYRDDGAGLWDGLAAPPPQADTVDVMIEAVRLQHERRSDADRREGEPDRTSLSAPGRARPAGFDERGQVIGVYPEWDREAGVERRDWTTVRDTAVAAGDPGRTDALVASRPDLTAWIARMLRRARIGRLARLRRQPEGPDLDLDALIENEIDVRSGHVREPRVYRATVRRHRDVAVTILLDCSESMRAPVRGQTATALDVQRHAVALVAEAMEAAGDPFALRAFASAGRHDVRLLRIKEFREPWSVASKARLAGLAPGLSTRIGAALRHAGAEIAAMPNHRRLILVLTDGEASDIDVADPADLVEDARRVVRGLKHRGIDVFGVTLEAGEHLPAAAGDAIFGRSNWLSLRHIEDLPERLSELYFRLTRH